MMCIAASAEQPSGRDHWAFQPLRLVVVPVVKQTDAVHTPVDAFILARLEAVGLGYRPPTDRSTWLRRITFDLLGRPPSTEELAEFFADREPDAAVRLVDRLLASPQYGERWGKYWLDTAGYADSNGYFNADSDRPLAYHYRDYVIRAFNADLPFDQLIREQLAGDELAGGAMVEKAADERSEAEVLRLRDLVAAVHYLRNPQDGTSESDGNPDERTIDRATVLEGAVQLIGNSLLGLTIQCARCHAHKFEPIAHEDYYSLQAVLYPAFPAFHPDQWQGPKDRRVALATAAEQTAYQADLKRIDDAITAEREAFTRWLKEHRPSVEALFEDRFDGTEPLAQWTNTLPGQTASAGSPPIRLGETQAPAAIVKDGTLQILESGDAGDRWLATRERFDWTPEQPGDWLEVTFDLIADRLTLEGKGAERIAFVISAHDFDDSTSTRGGNLLVDGNPAGGAVVHLDYPGLDAKSIGTLGKSGYKPGRNYGVRITNVDNKSFRFEPLVDGATEANTLTFAADDLPDGAFAWEYCCGRSFIVDNLRIERSPQTDAGRAAWKTFAAEQETRTKTLNQSIEALNRQRRDPPGQRAAVANRFETPPEVFLLERGDYATRGPQVPPAVPRVLSESTPTVPAATSQGLRTAFAQRLTGDDPRATGLVARVLVNRLWQHHFGVGLVATPDNFGVSGRRPSHPELLEFLANELIRSGWSIKTLHRLIVLSAAYQQQTLQESDAAEPLASDADNALLSRFPLRRLDSEALRDAMLFVAGELDADLYGPYLATKREGDGNVIVDEDQPQARRRGVYLQQRRSQVHSWQAVFDAPAMVSSCSQRNASTVPLQSLALLNSEFTRRRATSWAERLRAESASDADRIERAFLAAFSRAPTADERTATLQFVAAQRQTYSPADDADMRAWTDCCQMLLASNAFLYGE